MCQPMLLYGSDCMLLGTLIRTEKAGDKLVKFIETMSRIIKTMPFNRFIKGLKCKNYC